MASVNRVILVGRLGSDPELNRTGSDMAVVKLSVATSEVRQKDGQKVEVTEWHKVIAWDKLAETCAKFLAKGRMVYVEGKLQTRSWEHNGTKHWSTEIVAQTVQFLDKAPAGDQQAPNTSLPAKAKESVVAGPDDDLESIPF